MIKKIKIYFSKNIGSALVLALVMITVIVIICSAVLSGIFLQFKFIRKQVDSLKALNLAEAGVYKTIWYLSGNEGKGPLWRTMNESIELFDDTFASVSIEEWGGYLEVHSSTEYKNVRKTVRVLLGEKLSEPFRYAIQLGEVKYQNAGVRKKSNKRGFGYPLVVTGKNRITGDVSVGLKGVEKGVIRGRGFEGERLVEGRINKVQNPLLPVFNNKLFRNAFERYRKSILIRPQNATFDPYVLIDDELISKLEDKRLYISADIEFNNLGEKKIIEGPLFISCSGNITFRGNSRIGNAVEFAADGKIIIMDQVQMNDCILFAEKGIEISGQCRLDAQLFSPEDIIIKDQAILSYPSVLYCSGRLEEKELKGLIILQDQAVVQGTIISYPEEINISDIRDITMIRIEKQARAVGVIYSHHHTSIEGTVLGNVSTSEFFLYVSPTTYLNWLRDATIDRTKLPDNFLMAGYFSEKPKLEVLHWKELKIDST
jgi:hypothetical protein